MKSSCEKCGEVLAADGEAYICSYECTFCPACIADMNGHCLSCGGELSRRPPRRFSISPPPGGDVAAPPILRQPKVWALSFAVWGFLTLAAVIWIYQYDVSVGTPMHVVEELHLELSEVFTFAPLTPFVLALALLYPIKKGAWLRPFSMLLMGGVLFALAHVALRGATHGVWDTAARNFVPIWNIQGHVVHVRWNLLKRLLMLNWLNDIAWTYAPIVVVAYAISYYQKFREREVRTAQLEIHLARAHLQSLKSQLRPHFLFNTMHSISALMLTDVHAADKMMTRLSDLLRMSLEDGALQMTTLNRELEFIGGYLEIEKIRFEDRLNVHLDIAAETLDAEVPHLILQPLVENAVRHGIAKRTAAGELRIQSTRDNNNLWLRVRDNGPGFAESSGSGSKSSLGVRATRERLQTLYGHDQNFSVRNLTEGGVEACVRIPFRVDARPSVYEIVSEDPETSL